MASFSVFLLLSSISLLCMSLSLTIANTNAGEVSIPPTSRFAVLMDAGSTGTRVHIYSWDATQPLETIKEVASTKVRIPLSSLVNDEVGVQSLLGTLINYADTHIPDHHREATSISLKATAGLRRLPTSSQEILITTVHAHFLDSEYAFLAEETSVIPGHEEALYDFMAVVVAMEEGTGTGTGMGIGVLDMGGASKQLSYVMDLDLDPEKGKEEKEEDNEKEKEQRMVVEVNTDGESVLVLATEEGGGGGGGASSEGVCVPDYVLHLPGSTGPSGLVARSIEGMGLLAAMDLILDLYVTSKGVGEGDGGGEGGGDGAGSEGGTGTGIGMGDEGHTVLPQPCLAVGETVKGEIHDYDTPLQGYGNVTECYELIRHHFLDKVAAEIDLGCLQKHKPSKFIAMDNFPKLMEMLGLVGGEGHDLDTMHTITPQAVLEAGQAICQVSWQDLLARFPASYPAYRAQRACFGAAYIYFFMTDVYGISELSQGEFFPLERHGEHDLGWVLGAVAVTAHSDTHTEGRDENEKRIITKVL